MTTKATCNNLSCDFESRMCLLCRLVYVHHAVFGPPTVMTAPPSVIIST